MNPTMISLLINGCTIKWPDGYWMKGNPDTKTITVGEDHHQPVTKVPLTPLGIEEGLDIIGRLEAKNKE